MKPGLSSVERTTRASIPAAVLAGTLLLTCVAAFYIQKSIEANDRIRFERSAQEISGTIDGRLDTYVALLRAGTGLFAASKSVEQNEFQKFVAHLDLPRHYPGVQGIGFSLRVRANERARLVETMRATGHPDFKIWPEDERPE